MSSLKYWIPALALALTATVLSADDLSGANTFLCSVSQVTACPLDEACVTGSPWQKNVPRFILVDVEKKTMAATAASGENRTTPVDRLERGDGLIILQGSELGRAFSFTIAEDTGLMTIAVALKGEGVVGFGACTPTPAK